MSEIEIKFGIPAAALAAVERSLRRLGATSSAIESQYWDSAGDRLAAAHLILRLRKTDDAWEQTLKAPGPSVAERAEETVLLPGSWPARGPAIDVGLHAGTEAGALLAKVLAKHPAAAELVPVYRSVVERTALRLEIAGSEVEIALDRGRLEAGELSLPICELEVELKQGDAAALIAVGRTNIDAHGMWLSTLTKSARGLHLARSVAGKSKGWAVKARRTELRDAATGPEIFRALLASSLEQVLANSSALAAGDLDPEIVHQLRVGLRRLRTVWRELAPWRGSLDERWLTPATALFHALGDCRDRQTVATSLQHRLAEAGSPASASRYQSTRLAVDPVLLVRDAAFQHALLDLLAFILRPLPKRAPQADGAQPEVLIAARLHKLHARLQHEATRFHRLDEAERHRARKRLKRLRYLAEMVRSRYDGVGRFLERLEPAQDTLGRYVDLTVGLRMANEAVARGDTGALFDVGWLQAQMPEAVDSCGKALRRAAEARPFWRGARSR